MSTQPTQPPQTPGTPEPARARPSSRVVAILTAGLGAAVVVGTVVGSVVPTVAAAAASDRTEQSEIAVDGVRDLDLDVADTRFTLRFADVDEASLEVQGASEGSWTLRRDGDTLVVSSPDRGWFSWGWLGSGDRSATLTVPRSLEGADTDVDLGAGSFFADGRFGELDVEVGAGQVTLEGSAETLAMQLGAGRGDIDLEGVRTADLDISAGAIAGRLSGDAPDEIEISVSAGSLELIVPDDEYEVTSDVSAGDFSHDLRTSAGAPHRIHAEVSAGDASVTAE